MVIEAIKNSKGKEVARGGTCERRVIIKPCRGPTEHDMYRTHNYIMS